ncbi:hypothetical protein K490DRAFT_34085 [Saccharata proteae CBS 121410]|uniref:Uncharacterized protein n=1 Tax=Saccharata proteae CBS 121410 TaxID=1314787 RepID=A0A9P4HZI9_9PEZI|nr:hypothetical protein K490DRAFT_34085 [Saccharata proteae CBS 121410]
MEPGPKHTDIRPSSQDTDGTTIAASTSKDDNIIEPSTTKQSSRVGGSHESSPASPTWPLTKVRVRHAKEKAKRKAKKALRIDDTPEQIKANEDGLFDELENNPAFNPQTAFPDARPDSIQSAVRKTAVSLKHAGRSVVHPKTAVQRHAARKLATPDQPYLSVQEDRLLLEAQDRLVECEESSLSGNEDEAREWEDVIEDMEAKRESMRVAWTTSRFVHRVRVVPNPQEHIDYPHPSDFRIYDEEGNYVRTDWSKWWGSYVLFATQDATTRNMDVADEMPFNRDIFLEHFERALMASAPWQAYFLDLRKIWRWEEPYRTGRWFAIFIFLWLVDYVITFCLCYVIVIVLLNRYRPKSVESLRESHNRAMDQGASAYKISELISKHGRGKWLTPLIQSIGPRAQVQLSDLADFLEMLQNFYDWKFAEKTWSSLFVWAAATALGALTPTGYTMRMVQLVLILWFFTGRPVASYRPMYRHLVSPMAYVWWDIPTHAQWSFRYLRKKAQEVRHMALPDESNSLFKSTPADPDDDDDDDDDALSLLSYHTTPTVPRPVIPSLNFLAFRCHHHGVPGRLAVFAHGIRFTRLFPQREIWRRQFTELVEMRKVSTSSLSLARTKAGTSKQAGGTCGDGGFKMFREKQLEFLWRDGTVTVVERVRNRDEAFNSIVGFSGLQWQVLQPVAGTNERDAER